MIRLRNGGQISASEGTAAFSTLTGLLERAPDRLAAMAAIALGRPGDAAPEHVAALTKGLMLRPDGSIPDYLRVVLLAAYQETPEGPVLVNPFRPENEVQVRRLERLDRDALERLRRVLGGYDGDDPPDVSGRGRG